MPRRPLGCSDMISTVSSAGCSRFFVTSDVDGPVRRRGFGFAICDDPDPDPILDFLDSGKVVLSSLYRKDAGVLCEFLSRLVLL